MNSYFNVLLYYLIYSQQFVEKINENALVAVIMKVSTSFYR